MGNWERTGIMSLLFGDWCSTTCFIEEFWELLISLSYYLMSVVKFRGIIGTLVFTWTLLILTVLLYGWRIDNWVATCKSSLLLSAIAASILVGSSAIVIFKIFSIFVVDSRSIAPAITFVSCLWWLLNTVRLSVSSLTRCDLLLIELFWMYLAYAVLLL